MTRYPCRTVAMPLPLMAAALVWLALGSTATLATRGASAAAFDRRCIPPGCVAPPSHIPDILGRRALQWPVATFVQRGLGATRHLHHGLLVASAQPQPPKQPEEFVPIDQLPPEEQLPAAPLLVTAYAFVWIAVIVYVWSIWRRLGSVEKELAEIARRTHDQRRSV